MPHLLAAMRRRLPQWPGRRRSARVFDEEAASASATRRRPWSEGLSALLAVVRAPLAAASCLASQADEFPDAAGRLHAAELGDLVVGEAMRFAIYL